MVGIRLLLATELTGDVLLPPFNRWGNRDLERFEQLNPRSHSKMCGREGNRDKVFHYFMSFLYNTKIKILHQTKL